MAYQRPCGNAYIPSSWADHKNRNPPSSEPGTDYAVPVGTHVHCAEAGTVVDIKTSNSSATGRYVTVALDDGRTVRYLHLQDIFVWTGYRVPRGAVLAASGASGNGSDWYYGAHVHTTLWPGAIWAAPTIDFELYAADDPPPPEPEPEPIPVLEAAMLCVVNTDTGGTVYTVSDRYLHHVPGSDEANVAANLYNAGVTWRKNADTQRVELTNGFFLELLDANGISREAANDVLGGKTWHDGALTGDKPSSDSQVLLGPAWFIGIFLGLIGVVEVLRFIVDLVV